MFRMLRLATVALGGFFFIGMHGESPSTAPATPIDRMQTTPLPGGPSEMGAPVPTIHTRSNLVVVDVVVNDSKGNPVHGLKAEDFTLLENKRPQSIRNFEEHAAFPASETSKITTQEKLPAGVFTNKSVAPANGPVNVLLLDYLNTPLAAQPYARKQLIDYLNKQTPGTRIAIFALTTNLVMLQGFSSDPEVLKTALTSKEGVPQASAILTDPMNGGLQGYDIEGNSNLLPGPSGGSAVQKQNAERQKALQTAFEQDLRAKITLEAFDLLSRYLVGIPGRKNVIWFSGSFPLSVEPDPKMDLQAMFDSVVRNDDEVRKTDNLLTRAQIAVYPVDARGVFNDPAHFATNGAMNDPPTESAGANATSSVSTKDQTLQMAFLQQTAQEDETMFAMAEDTGGRAFINSNNLAESVAKAIDNGSNYYTLTYTPTNAQWDGRFRAIKVKVGQPGVRLAYRDGYYADDPNDRNRTIAGKAATAASHSTIMTTAMLRGGPAPTEIVFKMRVRPVGAEPTEGLAKGNQANPKLNVTGPYRMYGVDLVPDKQAITCPLEAGSRHCALELATYVYNADGELLVTSTVWTSSNVGLDKYAEMQKTGMAFHQVISVPVKGTYYLRTAIHDLRSDRVGAMEIPVAAVAKLQPLQVAASGPAPGAKTPVTAPAPGTAPR